MSEFQFKLIPYQQTWDLRHRVLRPQQTLNDCKYTQDAAPHSFHIGAFAEQQIVCVASFHAEISGALPAKNPYRLRGMATDPAFLQRGIGKRVLIFGQEELSTRHGDLLWFNAREIAFPFYEKLGFKYLGELFDIPGIGPHKVMYKYMN